MKKKLTLYRYAALRDKVKFIEYYWYLYSRREPNFQNYLYLNEIQFFLEHNLYELITVAKLHLFSKKVSLSQKNYQQLRKYASISDHLLRRIPPLSSVTSPSSKLK